MGKISLGISVVKIMGRINKIEREVRRREGYMKLKEPYFYRYQKLSRKQN
jgi:hypothetical protein